MNFKTNKPDIYRMMGEFYKLLESLYDDEDWTSICEKSDAFVQKWTANMSGLDKELVIELVQGILRAKVNYEKEERKNGRQNA